MGGVRGLKETKSGGAGGDKNKSENVCTTYAESGGKRVHKKLMTSDDSRTGVGKIVPFLGFYLSS